MASFYTDARTDVAQSAQLERLKLTNVTSTSKIIGKGAYGRVIEVYVHGTLCAAKEVHSSLVDNVLPQEFEGTKKAFFTECVNASRILHPNVVQMLGIHYPTRQAKLPWLVMEMMEFSLKMFLEKFDRDKVPVCTKLSILVDVSQGLEFLHGQNVVHRDLSSNNVLLTKHCVAKIADLGVAKVIEHNRMKTHTQAPGTPHFMPPEALSVKPRYGKPVDVFSVGCIALHAMSHQWPVPKDQVQLDSMYAMKLNTEVDRREEYLSWCDPDSLKLLVEMCLDNNPNHRPVISVVCAELKKLRNSVESQVSLAKASTIELLDAVQKGEVQMQILNEEMSRHKAHTEGKLLELEQQKVQLHQQLSQLQQLYSTLKQQNNALEQQNRESTIAKDQQIEVLNIVAEKQKKEIADLNEKCNQFYVQKVSSAQEQMLLRRDHPMINEAKLLESKPLVLQRNFSELEDIHKNVPQSGLQQRTSQGDTRQQRKIAKPQNKAGVISPPVLLEREIVPSTMHEDPVPRVQKFPLEKKYLPPPKGYTPEDNEHVKEEEKRKAKKACLKERELRQQLDWDWGETVGVCNEDAQHHKELGIQGKNLIQDIKEGLRQGFQLEEIQLATQLQHGYRSPSSFLLREWHNYIERTKFQAGQYSDEEHRKRRMFGSIGRPNRKEIVKVLIEEGGDCDRAARKCCMNRMKMILEIISEGKLPESKAVLALENNDLNVEKAMHDIYHEKITNAQMYDYIWGVLEGGGVRKVQNDKVGKMITEKQHRDDYLHRLLMAEYELPTTNHCEVLIHLVRECNLSLGVCLDVARTNDDIETARNLLTRECPICIVEYFTDEMVNMVHCDHAVCKDCFVTHFTLMIGEKSIKHFNCPCCGEPDMSSDTFDMDLYLQMFSGLIQVYLNKECYDLCTRKLNEHTMLKNPNFCWCIKCTTGFINEVGRQMVQCPNMKCSQQMCFQCKKPWVPAHDGLSCEQFAQWEIDNDPELQAQGLAAYLNEEGIECPSCGFRYAVAKGVHIHFQCDLCPAEFCSGCNGFFKKDCVKCESCRNKGLHAHHPRDCLFYLRDETVDDLQKLLADNNVQFDTEPPKGQIDAETAKGIQAVEGLADAQPVLPLAAPPVLKCCVMLQKENPEGIPLDEECGNAVERGHAGL
ncbi:uncharacterized protein [Dysidea avara]